MSDTVNTTEYDNLYLYIDGEFLTGSGRAAQPVTDPATQETIGELPLANAADLDRAVAAAKRALAGWRDASPTVRSDILRRAAQFTRERAAAIGRQITLDQGKPLAEAISEVAMSAEHAEWHAEEGRRIYGRVIPSRSVDVRQMVLREPIGVCAAFMPWNFPFNQAMRKIAAALGAGCTLVLKGPEDSPSAIVALARLFHDAGLPPGCLNIVWGVPQDVSRHLIDAPDVRKISFTGSVPIGKQLAGMAAQRMKRCTMELGGHAPVLVCDDAEVEKAVDLLVPFKYRNAGQVCVSPTRFFVQRRVYAEFAERFVAKAAALKLGPGSSPGTQMGPLAHGRRVTEISSFVSDAREKGAKIAAGGRALDGPGHFFQPTVVLSPSADCRLMNDEPFGPVAAIVPFDDLDEALARANGVPYGLAAYAFTRSSRNAHAIARGIEAGLVNINHFGMGFPEIPFGGVKESGWGSEGGTESFDGYLVTKFVTHLN